MLDLASKEEARSHIKNLEKKLTWSGVIHTHHSSSIETYFEKKSSIEKYFEKLGNRIRGGREQRRLPRRVSNGICSFTN